VRLPNSATLAYIAQFNRHRPSILYYTFSASCQAIVS
jgi:hypothetical protein